MKPGRRRIEVNLEELDRVLDGARANAFERGRLRQAQGRIACLGGEAGATAPYGEDPRRTGSIGGLGNGRWKFGGDQYSPAARTWTQRGRGFWRRPKGRHCAPEAGARGSLPGVRQGQRIRAEGAEGAGAGCGAGSAGGHRLLARALALRGLRAGVYGPRAGRSGSGKVR